MRPFRPVFSYATFLVIVFITMLVLFESCANVIPPTGGPRDTIPPIPVSIKPADSTLNFRGDRIELVFNEYVQLGDLQKNLVVSPTPKVFPVVTSRLRTITIRIKDTLDPNTTYVLDFGKSIQDINESNPLTGFRYAFSTGPYLDSLELGGVVTLAETGKTDSTMIVMLHKNLEDSAVTNERPRYYTTVDSSGRFLFRNLAPGTYALYALKDEGGSRRYMSPGQLFAFADSPLVISGETAPVELLAYSEPEPVKPVKAAPKAPTSRREEKEAEQDKRLRFGTSLENGQQDLLKPLTITFPDPLKAFDSTKLILADAQFKPIEGYTLARDTTNRIFTLSYNWPLEQEFVLISEKGMAEDSLGKSILRNDTLRFKTMKETDYGSIKFRIANVDTARNPVLQLVQNNNVLFSYRIRGRDLVIQRFRPAEFELRVLYDTNGNGVWDHGVFYGERRQPERVQAIGKKVNIKANWDNEIDISL
ncbi:Ig-like domain-containing domain [Flavihumibacter sp. ZG627]|uniref:Ig-like domain-containing domain n=1 Tax=Flavihumibacter sp. ZG627 TaxID=1463156 RepID=UPI00057E19D7|nr:Ig-like domain-containing domain [Flavihumibacter sp. ZG627]KIC91255.1 hypothetical protein HY58_09675 [Flavihumibacter sp. ZG627]